MGFLEAGKVCATCQRQTLHRQQTPNHVLHFLIAFLTCGAWLVVWFILSAWEQPWLCVTCGTRAAVAAQPDGDRTGAMVLVGVGVVALMAILAVTLIFLGVKYGK